MEQVTDKEKQTRIRKAVDKIGKDMLDKEWEYFQKFARNYGSEYGILIMGSKLILDNLIYAPEPLHLRMLHLEALAEGRGSSDIIKFRQFLNWLEGIGG